MTSKDPDQVKVSLVVDITVSERAWRAKCAELGIDLNGIVIPAHVAATIKQAAMQHFAALGFPQEPK